MTAPDGIIIDCMATARRVLASPEGAFTVTPHEVVALAACTYRESTGRMPELPVVQAPARPFLCASLAATVALALAAYDRSETLRKDFYETNSMDRLEADLSFHAAFNTLKSHFEKEFPNGNA